MGWDSYLTARALGACLIAAVRLAREQKHHEWPNSFEPNRGAIRLARLIYIRMLEGPSERN